MKEIIDEFTDLPVSKQRKRQLRARRDKLCVSCGKPVCAKSVQFCDYHLQYRRNYELQKNRTGVYIAPSNVEQRVKFRLLIDNFKKDVEKLFDETQPA